MAQTRFQLYSDKWAVGQIADNSLNQIDSFSAGTVIPFGSAVMRTTVNNNLSEKKVSAFSGTTAGTCIGFAIRREMAFTGQYEINSQVDVLRVGRIIVITHVPVTIDQVACLFTDGAIGIATQDQSIPVGKFVNNSKQETINVNGVITTVNLAELQIDILENA